MVPQNPRAKEVSWRREGSTGQCAPKVKGDATKKALAAFTEQCLSGGPSLLPKLRSGWRRGRPCQPHPTPALFLSSLGAELQPYSCSTAWR